MIIIQHPGPLMRLRIANEVAALTDADAIARRAKEALFLCGCDDTLHTHERVYLTALANALEAKLKEMS